MAKELTARPSASTDSGEEVRELALVRYGELALKGGNRAVFERVLADNVRAATKDLSKVRIERQRGRMLVVPERRAREVFLRLQHVFGIVSISPARTAPRSPEGIAAVADAALADALAGLPADRPITFRVETRRADKRFPMTSTELDRFVADRVLPGREQLAVRLERPELTLGVEVRDEAVYVFAERLPGPGGLPVGTQGRALCLLSGGIDSPVAAWYAMKRGCSVSYVAFHSAPYIGEASKRKLVRLVRALSRWQPRNRLFVLPFTAHQEAIRDAAPPPYRTVLYRRSMQRLASRVARRDKAQALVTGESLGQVASQTTENMTCIGAASELLVLRPLIGFDKQETIDVARRIGTFEISNVPEPDCCTVFLPDKPVIRGRLDVCEEVEARLDLASLDEAALAGVETVDV